MNLVFIDASAWIALYHKMNKYHQVAWKTYEQILHEPGAFWTSNWVAYEAISILKSRASYGAAMSLWDILQDAQIFQIVRIDRELEEKAVNLFWHYQDKIWGVVDCSSILLMEKMGCSSAFGFDHHFIEATRQYGFNLL